MRPPTRQVVLHKARKYEWRVRPSQHADASVADGDAIEWDALRALAADDPDIHRLLDHLCVVAGVAAVHRSQFAETITASIPPELVAASSPGQPPRRWGHLLLIRKIGEGAFGEVFEALDTWLDHPRALKLLKPAAANRASAPQILHEARKLVRIGTPTWSWSTAPTATTACRLLDGPR